MIFLGQKPKILKIRDSHFVEPPIWHLLAFCMRFASNFYILKVIEFWPFFVQKSLDMTSLKRHFLKNVSADFAEILGECAKLMLHNVLHVLRRYLHSFLSYRESSLGGGALCAPPPTNGGPGFSSYLCWSGKLYLLFFSPFKSYWGNTKVSGVKSNVGGAAIRQIVQKRHLNKIVLCFFLRALFLHEIKGFQSNWHR